MKHVYVKCLINITEQLSPNRARKNDVYGSGGNGIEINFFFTIPHFLFVFSNKQANHLRITYYTLTE